MALQPGAHSQAGHQRQAASCAGLEAVRDGRRDQAFTSGDPDSSQPGRLGEVDPESVSLPLIAAGHLGTGVAELPLDVAFIGLGGCGEGRRAGSVPKTSPAARLQKDHPEPRRRAPCA
jgi:hypothetical protein